ncbi:diphosphomevalonate decarboxylase [Saccharicrinis aurantiacus]|uniref:diphosphomevalonate decarboxylase n=1 Tax=Saccharicrinis aurantiacus TaxID=1849719 RepID=UPI002493345B|nr:diphosphomevalonate decarboxylase [Saccharicrinis aurantiacus]
MTKTNFIKTEGRVSVSAPSNIAIVKYWGKKDIQIPENPSISFSLNNAITQTSIQYKRIPLQDTFSYDFAFENITNKAFEKKLVTFFNRIENKLPWLKSFYLNIQSSNTFPHSSGIASSASSYAALAIALAKIHTQITAEKLSIPIISEMARLGSGSACRSVYGAWNTWGETPIINGSSNKYAQPLKTKIHPNFQNIHDSILLVSKKEKSVSSSVGHQLMENHPYKEGRIRQAHANMKLITEAIEQGNWTSFTEITELEALSLHGLMMSSTPSYCLLEPNSLAIINKIRDFRKETNIDLCFTIDAGPNIHVLYPESNKKQVQEFIDGDLGKFCSDNTAIHDYIGLGPKIN